MMPHDSPSMYEALPGRSGQPSMLHRGWAASFLERTYGLPVLTACRLFTPTQGVIQAALQPRSIAMLRVGSVLWEQPYWASACCCRRTYRWPRRPSFRASG